EHEGHVYPPALAALRRGQLAVYPVAPHLDEPAVEVEVRPLQGHCLTDSQPGTGQEENKSVVGRKIVLARGQEEGHLLSGQEVDFLLLFPLLLAGRSEDTDAGVAL